MSTVSGVIYTKDYATGDGLQSYDVWVPDDLADQLSDAGDRGWVSLTLYHADAYICLRARDITFFRREMTTAEKQLRHSKL